MNDLVTEIKGEGQPYVDEPVYEYPKKIALAVAVAFERWIPSLLVRHDRIYLRWMKPDGNGGLIPRGGKQ